MEKLKKKGAEEQREYYPGWREGRGGVRQEVGEIKHLFKWQACFGASRLARIPSSTYTHLIYVLFSAVFRARACAYTPRIHTYRHVDARTRRLRVCVEKYRGEGGRSCRWTIADRARVRALREGVGGCRYYDYAPEEGD